MSKSNSKRTLKLISIFFISLKIVIAQSEPITFQPIFKKDETVRSKSREIFKYMNVSVDPCQDFYAYACGNWHKHNAHLREHDLQTNVRYLEEKIEGLLQSLLEQQVTIADGVNGHKVKQFYSSCKTALAGGQRQQSFHIEFIKKHGGFPAIPGSNWGLLSSNYDWLHIIAQLRMRYGMNILIGVDVDINPYNKFENSVFLTEPDFLLSTKLCADRNLNSHRIDKNQEEYTSIENTTASNLKSWLSMKSELAFKVAKDILLLEYELCNGYHLQKDPYNTNIQSNNLLRRTVFEFTHYFNNSIDFNKFLLESFEMPFGQPVFLRSEQYFWNLIRTLNRYEKSTIANYIMYRALSKFSFPLNGNSKTRPRFCTQIVKEYFPQVLGSMYYYKYGSNEIKKKIKSIFDKLKISLENSLKSSWLEDGTSRVGLAKLNEISIYFPEYEQKPNLNDLTFDVNSYWDNLSLVMLQAQKEQLMHLLSSGNPKFSDPVEAYEPRVKYRREANRVEIGWALLQSPFYDDIYPNSMLYSMVGQRIARELTVAFNDLGWTSDLLNISNWDYVTAKNYENRSECLRMQISNYLNNEPLTFQNVTILRDFIAINSGLNIAFNAYLNWLDYLNPYNDFSILRKETLPELNFSNTQLFFIAYSQINCHFEESSKILKEAFPSLGHTLERFLINGPLQNSEKFSKEFDCRLGSEMNPAEKCVIY